MDVEKTILFLLESQRNAERRFARADKRMDRLDKQLRVTADLVKGGIRMIREGRKQTDFRLNALIDAQMRTDAQITRLEEQTRKTDEKFNRFLDSLNRKRSNGHN